MVDDVARIRSIVSRVVDPELPMLTLGELGILREVEIDAAGTVVVSLTPTYSGCPAMDAMGADVVDSLSRAGYPDVEVRLRLDPPWTTDWITEAGRRKLEAAGIAPPGPAPRRDTGPVPLLLQPRARPSSCPHCGSRDTEELSPFGATACRALHRCRACREPFERVKEI